MVFYVLMTILIKVVWNAPGSLVRGPRDGIGMLYEEDMGSCLRTEYSGLGVNTPVLHPSMEHRNIV